MLGDRTRGRRKLIPVETKATTIRLLPEIREWADTYGAETGKSLNLVIEEALCLLREHTKGGAS